MEYTRCNNQTNRFGSRPIIFQHYCLISIQERCEQWFLRWPQHNRFRSLKICTPNLLMQLSIAPDGLLYHYANDSWHTWIVRCAKARTRSLYPRRFNNLLSTHGHLRSLRTLTIASRALLRIHALCTSARYTRVYRCSNKSKSAAK